MADLKKPDWFSMAGTYEKSPGWYRNPSVGGGIQWSPIYGYQRKQDIGKANLTSNTGTDWRKLFPGARTDQELKSMGIAGKGNTLYKLFQQPGGYYDYSSWNKNWQPTAAQKSQYVNPAASTDSGNLAGILQAIMKMFQGGSSGGIA